jgi:hypothetical protein
VWEPFFRADATRLECTHVPARNIRKRHLSIGDEFLHGIIRKKHISLSAIARFNFRLEFVFLHLPGNFLTLRPSITRDYSRIVGKQEVVPKRVRGDENSSDLR